MTVRLATIDDRMRIACLLRDAHAAAQLPFPFSAPHALHLADRHIVEPRLLALVLEGGGGVLLASVQDHPFAPILYATETAWWIDPSKRGEGAAMLAAYEAWALEHGCAFAGMASLASFPRAGVLYRRRGYVAAETHYLKALAS